MRPSGPALAVLLLLGLVAGGCAAVGASPTPSRTPVSPDPFAGRGWVLIALDSRPPLAGTKVTLGFVGGWLRGSAGCNDYGGPFTATTGGALAAPEIGSTARGCPAPEIAEQERRYLDTLRAVTTYRRDGAQLRLETTDGRALIFTQGE